jgi:predicted DNA-binding protein YlxM (UPF0122 family)
MTRKKSTINGISNRGIIKEPKYQTRSSKYQWIINELPYDLTEFANIFSNKHSLQGRLNSFQYNEESTLKDQLWDLLYSLMKDNLTEFQFKVISLYLEGMTQLEIAKEVNCNQTSVCKTINGNKMYYTVNSGENRIVFGGGIVRKLKKLVAKDQRIQTLLNKIKDLEEEIL